MGYSENKVAKNTLFLYFRMLLTLVVSLYTSRVILKTLGFEDYGIYNLVGGVVAIFSFMNSSLSGAASRFIAFALGQKDEVKCRKQFSNLLTIHVIVAIMIVLICETVGLFLLDRLVIPEGRLLAAKIIYHISVVTAAINVLRIPFNASIIAHEDMKTFAYVSIIEVLLKLLIVYLLNIIRFDKLITYSFLYLGIVLLITIIYAVFCLASYRDVQFSLGYDKHSFKSIFSYFSWDLFGNFSVVLNAQGTNIILNLFGGVVVNSASAISNQVRSAVYGFASNFMLAMNPQIIKNYASGEIATMNRLMIKGGVLSFTLLWFFTLPIILEIDFVLHLWLEEVPEYTSWFVIMALVFSAIQAMYTSVNIGIHATGQIKSLSFIGGTILLSSVLISYLIMLKYDNVLIPFILNIGAVVLSAFINLLLIKKEMSDFSIKDFIIKVYLKAFIIGVLSFPLPAICRYCLDQSFFRFALVVLISCVVILFLSYFLVLDCMEKQKIKAWLLNN